MAKCECGCGTEVRGRFAQGHNQRRNFKYDDGLTPKERHNIKVRSDAFNAYGGKCACCGETEHEFLVIDHVKNDGAAHRKELRPDRPRGASGQDFYRWLRDQGYPQDGRFQVLCANCNLAKMRARGCPHQRDVDVKPWGK
jgi:hypothetical protein